MKNILFSVAIIFSANLFASDAGVLDTLLAVKHFTLQEDQAASCPKDFSVEMDATSLYLHGLLERAIPVALVNVGEKQIEAKGNFLNGFRSTSLTVKARSKSLEVIEVEKKGFFNEDKHTSQYLKIKTHGDEAEVQIKFERCDYRSR
jgi:hypothetical protein